MFFENYDACLISNPAAGKQSHYFTGKELDTSGLYHYGARYYHPLIAHFTQPDPLIQDPYDPQTLNHYAYCRNNPLFYTDPTGMSLFGPSWGGFGNWWGSFWGGMGNMFSFGISTIGRWGMQMNSFMYSQVSAAGDFFGSTFNMGLRGMYDFSRFAWDETKIWGSAFKIGLGHNLRGIGSWLGNSKDLFSFAISTMMKPDSSLDNKQRWWPKGIDLFIPGYRSYGGPLRTGFGPAQDLMDQAFKMHDLGYSAGKAFEADQRLVLDLTNLPANPYKWGSGINPFYAVAYREASLIIFSNSVAIRQIINYIDINIMRGKDEN